MNVNVHRFIIFHSLQQHINHSKVKGWKVEGLVAAVHIYRAAMAGADMKQRESCSF